jgi:hypothetical protein
MSLQYGWPRYVLHGTVEKQPKISASTVSFQEAESVFYDEYAILIDDPEHSVDVKIVSHSLD